MPWKDNFGKAEDRKEERYNKLMEECKVQSWNMEYYHLAVVNIFRYRFGFSAAELKRLKCALQQTVETASL